MPVLRKRSRDTGDECPFSICHVDARQCRKQRRQDEETGSIIAKAYRLRNPFKPAGNFRQTKQCPYYTVEPFIQWSKMTPYKRFINTKRFSLGDFVFVANDNTIERQESTLSDSQTEPTPRDYWVARILEIRARDEHHIYVRICWMYRPDELPSKTLYGGKFISGRQPYHGRNELIASNHMTIIDVLSITDLVTVHQVVKEDDNQIQNDLYWRQVLDVHTNELSTLPLYCQCNTPAHLENVLVECPKENCGRWLHEECLRHEVLMKVWEQHGTQMPANLVKAEKASAEAKRSLALIDSISVVVADKRPIQAAKSGEAGSRKADGLVDVQETRGIAPENSCRKGKDMSYRPYAGLFEANFNRHDSTFQIKDLRAPAEDRQKTWLVDASCLVCNTTLSEGIGSWANSRLGLNKDEGGTS